MHLKKLLKPNAAWVFLLLFPWVLATLQRDMADYGNYLRSTRAWLAGESDLYNGALIFYYTPSALILYGPLSFLPDRVGQLIFNALSLAALVWGTWSLTRPAPWWALAIALTNVHTGWLILNSQWDAFILASLALGWLAVQREPGDHQAPWLLGVALVGMSSKPTNVLLPALMLLYAIRRWPVRSWIYTLLPMVSVFIASVIALGLDWPLRMLRSLQNYPWEAYALLFPWGKADYKFSFWDSLSRQFQIVLIVLVVLGLILLVLRLRRQVGWVEYYLALVVNLIGTPYLLIYHCVYLHPLTAWLLNEDNCLGALLVLAIIADMLLSFFGVGLLVYPLIALLTLLIYMAKNWWKKPARQVLAERTGINHGEN